MGGGSLCNELRTLHDRFELSEGLSHHLSMEMMGITAVLLADLLNMPVLFSIDSIHDTSEDVVFDCRQWVTGFYEVPQTWQVTSDSISALLAKALDADLVLMKSVDGWDSVDEYFQQAADGIEKVDLVNLRT